MQGPAFSLAFKALATLLVFGCVAWFANLWLQGLAVAGTSGFAWFAAALALMLYTWWCMVRSVTTINATELQQTWVWHKKMELRELAYGKLIRVRGLDWLIAPRLYVRTLMGKFAVFYVADPAMVAEFERLIAELRKFRGFDK